MKKKRSLFYSIFIFVFAEVSLLAILGLWIYWFISNSFLFKKLAEAGEPLKIVNITIFVIGLILITAIANGTALMFASLARQININRLYDNFISNVTHELKSPLASIQLHLETINLRKIKKDKIIYFTDLMIKDAQRLEGLINTILEVSRMEQKKAAYNFQIYSADKLYKGLIEEAVKQHCLPLGAVTIKGKLKCNCIVDKNAIKIVVNNLISNAVKYTKNKIRIRITLSTTKKMICAAFTDNGIGLSPENRGKVFKKFHRIYQKNSPNVKGTGLGLYLVKEIIKHHKGKISVSSIPDKGSTFKIELPIYSETKKRYNERTPVKQVV